MTTKREALASAFSEAFAWAAVLNDRLAIDIANVAKAGIDAGFTDLREIFPALKPCDLVAARRRVRKRVRRLGVIHAWYEAMDEYGAGGRFGWALLSPHSAAVPPRYHHYRVALKEDGQVIWLDRYKTTAIADGAVMLVDRLACPELVVDRVPIGGAA